MGILDQLDEGTQAPVQNYTFLTGEDDNFIKELRQPKQSIIKDSQFSSDFAASSPEESEQLDNFFNNSETDEGGNALSLADAENLGGMLVGALDIAASYGLAAIAKDKENREQFLLTPYETERATKVAGKYLQTKGGKIPDWALLLIVLGGIYGGKIAGAVQLRKAKEREEKLEADLVNSKDVIKALEDKLEKAKNGSTTTDNTDKEQ